MDDRSDLDMYAAIVGELGAVSVLDVGCGTGTFACRLALGGADVVGLDPAAASLDVARRKKGGDKVRWVHGDTSCLPRLDVDLAVMTGNVAQVFLSDTDWSQVLKAVHNAVSEGSWLVFETRDPAQRAWERWTKEHTYRELRRPTSGRVDTWTELLQVQAPFVSFRHVFRFHADNVEIVSDSTLRFRSDDEIAESLDVAGFTVREIRDAPDRPGLEFVFMAQRSARATDLTVVRHIGSTGPLQTGEEVATFEQEIHSHEDLCDGEISCDAQESRATISCHDSAFRARRRAGRHVPLAVGDRSDEATRPTGTAA